MEREVRFVNFLKQVGHGLINEKEKRCVVFAELSRGITGKDKGPTAWSDAKGRRPYRVSLDGDHESTGFRAGKAF